jgi:hypothetical protein
MGPEELPVIKEGEITNECRVVLLHAYDDCSLALEYRKLQRNG